jgi:hypothetical protein
MLQELCARSTKQHHDAAEAESEHALLQSAQCGGGGRTNAVTRERQKKRDEALFDRPYQRLANDAARLYLQSAAQQLSGVASAKARKDEGSDSICKRHIKSFNPKRRHTLQRSPSAHRDNRETARHADVASAVTALHLPRKASAGCTSYRRRCLVRWTA